MDASTDLLIWQWRNSPNLTALVEIWLDVITENIETPLVALGEMRNLNTARGIWLDRIGERLGLLRPSAVAKPDDYFGFDDAGLGFDRGRLTGNAENLPREPIGDELYRQLLRARGVALYAEGTLADFTRAARMIDAGAVVRGNDDMTMAITTGRTFEMQLADEVGALPRPAGVGAVKISRDQFGFDEAGIPFDQGVLR